MFRAIAGLARDESIAITGGSFFFLVSMVTHFLTVTSPVIGVPEKWCLFGNCEGVYRKLVSRHQRQHVCSREAKLHVVYVLFLHYCCPDEPTAQVLLMLGGFLLAQSMLLAPPYVS